MRIELGPEGQVIGTKRVNANGQIGGLKSFAGQDLLVVQPGHHAEFRHTMRDRIHQARSLLAEQARATREEAQHLAKTLRAEGGLQKAYEAYVETPLKESLSTTRTWVKDQRQEMEARFEATQRRVEAEIAERRAQARKAAKSVERRVDDRRRDVEEAVLELRRKLRKQTKTLGRTRGNGVSERTNGKKTATRAAA